MTARSKNPPRQALVAGASIAIAVAWGGLAQAQIGSSPPEVIQDGTAGLGNPNATPLRLNQSQRNTIAQVVRSDGKAVAPPPSFVVSVGAPVPPAMELHLLPDAALAKVPEAKHVRYTVVNNQVVLIDPTTMRVVEVISQ